MSYVLIYDSRRLVRSDSPDVTIVLPIAAGGTGNTTGTATVNANLTGPITSAGNVTSIASQTGTGSKIVVDSSPTIVTPTIASMVNATHNHQDAAGGGTLTGAALPNVWTAFAPTLTAATGTITGSGPQTARYSANTNKVLDIMLFAASIYTLAGGPSASLILTIPGGFKAAARASGTIQQSGGSGAVGIGSWQVLAAGATTISLFGDTNLAGAWANGIVGFIGPISFEIQ